MILVDTSVWIDHLRVGNQRLKSLLYDDRVLTHPYIVGELACGSVRNLREVLQLLQALPQARVAEHEEVLSFVESRRLYGRGIGWVDAHLLAAALLSGAALWTLDRRLARLASALKISA
ncbi:MAG: PIN domain-containing protein [Armatimonadetes bacterium]|nr:PIN domain-containing protein [Armatimonadota bacterium]